MNGISFIIKKTCNDKCNYPLFKLNLNMTLRRYKNLYERLSYQTQIERMQPNAFQSRFSELHRLGWLSAFIPEILGGPGLNTLDLACIAREIAYGSSGIFSSYTVNVLALSPIILYASDDLKAKLCADFLGQFSLWSYCMTEPGAGSNIAHAHTRARKVTGGYEINGEKCFITNAGFSKHLLVFAQLESEDQSSRI